MKKLVAGERLLYHSVKVGISAAGDKTVPQIHFKFSLSAQRSRSQRIDGSAKRQRRRNRGRHAELDQPSLAHELNLVGKAVVKENRRELYLAVPGKLLNAAV